uniref:Uncharacterized protein n=1 Tax=Cannabis sativa TaxID=3483 RepID=A0A803Q874_CANSA
MSSQMTAAFSAVANLRQQATYFSLVHLRLSVYCRLKQLHWKIESVDLDAILRCIERSKAGRFRKSIWYTVIASAVYQIWKARNLLLWDSKEPRVIEVTRNIKEEVKSRFTYVWP